MKTQKLIRACLAGLLGLAACEGNTWPTNPSASGLDARAPLPAAESAPLVDAPASMGSSHPVADPPLAPVAARPDVTIARDATAAVDSPLASADAIAADAAPIVAATEPTTVFVPVYVPLYVPTGSGNVGAVVPATPVGTSAVPALVAPVTSAPIGTGGTLGQYGTPGAFSSTGVTAGDPGTLRGTFP